VNGERRGLCFLQRLDRYISAIVFRASHESVEADRGRHYKSVVVVGVFADQVDAAGGAEDCAGSAETFFRIQIGDFRQAYESCDGKLTEAYSYRSRGLITTRRSTRVVCFPLLPYQLNAPRSSMCMSMSGRVGINAEGAGALQLFLRVAATEEAYRESALAAGGENVPNTVTRHGCSLRRATRRRAAARTKTSGEGLALATSSPVTSGTFFEMRQILQARRWVCFLAAGGSDGPT